MALALLLAAAPPMAAGDWYAIQTKDKRILDLVVDDAGVRGFGYKRDGVEVPLVARGIGARVTLSAASDEGRAQVHWFPDGPDAATLWFEGQLWRARRVAPAPPELVVGLQLFVPGHDDEEPDRFAFDKKTMVLGLDGAGLEAIRRGRTAGRYEARVGLRPAGHGTWLVHDDEGGVVIAAADRPRWLSDVGLRSAERCRRTQWMAKTALQGAWVAVDSFRAELDRMPARLGDAGFAPPKDLPYRLKLSPRGKGFSIEALGLKKPVKDDRWVIDDERSLRNTLDVCAR